MEEWVKLGIAQKWDNSSVQTPSDMMLKMCRLARKQKFLKAVKIRDDIITLSRDRFEFNAYITEEGVRNELSRMMQTP
jgi:hypothetical protein